jgi:lipopolysaccharide/colanic/teichoic acid biosynthesis glycosyltransferase
MKRALDIAVAAAGLLAASPLLAVVLFLVWRQDGHTPFYFGMRVGRDGRPFRMVKIRSMTVNADRSGVNSTAGDDRRITPVGAFVRRWKLDELTQLWNVLRGEMSLVGPRPQVAADVARYTAVERGLLAARPGITDFASIVFADEGDILRGQAEPDLAYNQLIRPLKSRLGLFYAEHRTIAVDLALVALTVIGIVSRQRALAGVAGLLRRLGAPADLVEAARRTMPLRPAPPPGAADIVRSLAGAAP